MYSLNDMFLVLKRMGDKCYLPTIALNEVEVVGGIAVPYQFIRVKEHDVDNGILIVNKEVGNATEYNFQTSVWENSTKIEGALIKKVVFVTEEPRAPKPKSKFRKSVHHGYVSATESWPMAKPVTPTTVSVSFTYRQRINEDYELPTKDIQIADRKASFDIQIRQLKRLVSFEVSNDFLRKEFDPVKHYFFNALGLKRIKVSVLIEVGDGNIVSKTANSEKLKAIDASLVEIVIDRLINDVIIKSDGEVYQLEEKASDILKLNGENAKDQLEYLLNKLFDKGKTKHYNHLSYLSGKHLYGKMKLMFTGGPLSYMFLLQGKNSFFFVWEPYSADVATYIWKLKSPDDVQMKEEIEEIVEKIKWLKKGNKTGFIKTGDAWHEKIIHNYQLPGNGFKKWEEQLNEFLGI